MIISTFLRYTLASISLFFTALLVEAQPFVDSSSLLDPPITNQMTVYTAFSINEENGLADAIFSLSNTEIADWIDYSVAIRFNTSTGFLDARNGDIFQYNTNNALPIKFNTLYRVWLEIDLQNNTYNAYAQTDAMQTPQEILTNASFRKKDVSSLLYWSAIHNSQSHQNPLIVEDVVVVSAVGEYPDYIDTSDDDGDGIPAFKDNCPDTYNPLQTDIDGNGIGDACDSTSGNLNLALSFPGGSNGANNNVALPSFNITQLPITFELWYKPDVTQNYYATLWYNRGSKSNSGVQYDRWINTSKIKGVWNGASEVPDIAPIPGQWNHVALVVTEASKTIYINGIGYTETGSNFSNYAFDGITYLGFDNALPDRTLKGLIDEVRIWTSARSEAEIINTMFTPLTGEEANLLAYYNFNDQAEVATDITNNGFDGTINGASYVLSNIFDPMKIKVAKANKLNKFVNSNSVNNILMQLKIDVENQKNPLKIKELSFSTEGTTHLDDLEEIRIFQGENIPLYTSEHLIGVWSRSENLIVDLDYSLEVGTNYFWITAKIAEEANKGNLINVTPLALKITNGIEDYNIVPENISADAMLTVNPDAFVQNTKLPLSVITHTGATSVEGANFASFQQNAIMTYRGYQYVTYWNNVARVCIARRKLPYGEWKEIEFMDHTISPARASDNHYTISMGIAPNDGTIHLSYDHHNDPLRYKRSIKNLANDPENILWSAQSFGNKQNYLIAGSPIPNITYPRFIAKPNGDLLFEYRQGWSGDGDSFLWEYEAESSKWTYIGEYLNGTSINENAYTNGIHYDPLGNLHVSWVWRHTPNPLTNHDIYYAYSNDDGRKWYNADREHVGTAGTSPMGLNSPGLKVWTVGTNRGLINQESQAVDSKGNIHILQSYIADEQPNSTNFWGGRIDHGQLRHIYQDNKGIWRNDVIAPSGRNRSEIAVDANDNVYVVAGNYRIYFASAVDQWQNWTEFDVSESSLGMNEPLIDREALLNHNILSFVLAHVANDGHIIVPTYLLGVEEIGTSISNEADRKKLAVYPNPFQSSFSINSETPFSYTIYDLSGRILAKQKSAYHRALGQDLPSGIYILEIVQDQCMWQQKIVKRP